MCGRARLTVPNAVLEELYGLESIDEEVSPSLDIAPTEAMAVVRIVNGKRRLARLRWGLVPAWSKDLKAGNRAFNARVETVARAPHFRDAFRARRCLVIVDGFYEWKHEGRRKLPHDVHRASGDPFALAGLWERWTSSDGEVIETCTVVTRDAFGPVRALHDRMPLVVPPRLEDAWLDVGLDGLPALREALADPGGGDFAVEPVVLPAKAAAPQLKLFD